MTKKDYEFAAHEIHGYIEREKANSALTVPAEVFNSWVDIFVKVFEKDNPLLNEAKFREACYEGKHIRKSIREAV